MEDCFICIGFENENYIFSNPARDGIFKLSKGDILKRKLLGEKFKNIDNDFSIKVCYYHVDTESKSSHCLELSQGVLIQFIHNKYRDEDSFDIMCTKYGQPYEVSFKLSDNVFTTAYFLKGRRIPKSKLGTFYSTAVEYYSELENKTFELILSLVAELKLRLGFEVYSDEELGDRGFLGSIDFYFKSDSTFDFIDLSDACCSILFGVD